MVKRGGAEGEEENDEENSYWNSLVSKLDEPDVASRLTEVSCLGFAVAAFLLVYNLFCVRDRV
jgi:hypothetical protein